MDQLLPLSGPHSILGKSFVVYDDFGPKARGERMACSMYDDFVNRQINLMVCVHFFYIYSIGGLYRRKAVAKDWFPNVDESAVKGKIEFQQQTEFDITNVEVDLKDLDDNSGYHVHIASITSLFFVKYLFLKINFSLIQLHFTHSQLKIKINSISNM